MANVDVQKKVFKRKLKKLKAANKVSSAKKPKAQDELPVEDNDGLKEEPTDGPDSSAEPTSNGATAHEKVVAENGKSRNQPEATATGVKSSILTEKQFEGLRGKVSEATLDSVRAMGFSRMTKIQAETIEPLLEVSGCMKHPSCV